MNVSLIVAALLLVALSVIGGLLARNFVREEAQRDLRVWQVRLGIVADSRFAAVDSWFNRQFDELTGLAENASLQIYMTELAAAGDDQSKRDVVEAQTDYLRNLLEATAVRAGFAEGPGGGGGFVANTQRTGTAGLALLDAGGQIVVATETMPPLSGVLRDFVGGLKPAERNLLDLHLNAAGRPTMGFSVPVFAIQSDRDVASQIGVIVGIKEIGDDLYSLLYQPGETSETASAVLVRRQGTTIEYLSPLPDGTPPLKLKIAANTPDLDAAFAIDKPGGFEEHRDYRNRAVLVTSRSFTTAPWTLMQTITSDEALSDSKARLQRLWAALILGMALLAVALLAVWRHGTSQRATESAVRYRALAGQFEDQRNLLRLVTDSQPTGIVILDAEGRYRFANREAAQIAGIPVEDMSGKPIANVLGPEAAKRYLNLNRQALDSGKVVSDVRRLEGDGRLRVLQSDHIPVSLKKDTPPSVLVVERDITEAVTERERRSRILSQIVRTLVGVVDRRDPYAADHSQRVAVLARAIATEMALPEHEIETAETAGNLLNLGKILVAPELLTKSGELSDEDRRKVRHSIQTSADLLQGIEFDGPVVETLRQAQAHWDGSGSPAGLAGDDILVTARIVGVANAFVGMVSRRAYREALDVDRALEVLLSQVGKAFDRRVVAALINYLDNRGGRVHWAERARQPVRA